MILRAFPLAVLVALLASPIVLRAQTRPLFTGAEQLDSCVVELPLTYAKKDKERYMQAARFLEDQELVYLRYDRKLDKGLYTRVYVVAETAQDGSEFVYVESAEDHLKLDGMRQAFFPKYNARTERFYDAGCFDRQLAAHPDLRTRVQEEAVSAPTK